MAIAKVLRERFPNIEYDDLNNKCLFQTGPYRSRIGHTMNAHRVIQKGEMLSNSPYCIIGGYYHVLERSMYWRHIPDEAMPYFKANVRAHHAGLAALKAGRKCSEIDQFVNGVYEEEGIDWWHQWHQRSFGTGHSLGIMTYWFGRESGPELRQYNDNVLKENMVVTMEPMINIDGLGGFRHHDICLVTKDGIENLNTFPNGVLLIDDNLELHEVWRPEKACPRKEFDMSVRLTAVIGGTFTDLVLLDANGELHVQKTSSTPGDFKQGVLTGVDKIIETARETPGNEDISLGDVDYLVHGAPVVLNALIERKLPDTALITTHGFRDVLRSQIQKLVEEGLSGRAAALRLNLSPATGARWGLPIRCTGQARVAPQGRQRSKGKLDPHRSFLID